jgi:hypothetical protein
MRLINCDTLELEEFSGSNVPRYAILSHTWVSDEVTFAHLPLSLPSTRSRKGYPKIANTCKQAKRDGLQYAWVDTCCIDKSSSAELSEAINSMFDWYHAASCCYAYLRDVSEKSFVQELPDSRWFKRGWTLQELIAPHEVILYDKHWKRLGTRKDHAEIISKVTGVDSIILRLGAAARGLRQQDPDGRISLNTFGIARRMSWASDRETTRKEDEAYCLMGLFDVNMPLLYGEGSRAFIRLEEEIIKTDDDDSILAYGPNTEDVTLTPRPDSRHPYPGAGAAQVSTEGVLPSSPSYFRNCRDLRPARSATPFIITTAGIEIQLPLVPVNFCIAAQSSQQYAGYVGLLSCSSTTVPRMLGMLLLELYDRDNKRRMIRVSHPTRGRSPWHTILVDLRIAALADVKKITIVRGYRHDNLGLDTDTLHYFVNPSSNLTSMGYRLVDGRGWYVQHQPMDLTGNTELQTRTTGLQPDRLSVRTLKDNCWQPQTRSYTDDKEEVSANLLSFTFRLGSTGSDADFTVYIATSTGNALVEQESVGLKTNEELRSLYRLLSDEHEPSTADDRMIDHNEESYEVSVELIEKIAIHQWRMHDINIDVVETMSS